MGEGARSAGTTSIRTRVYIRARLHAGTRPLGWGLGTSPLVCNTARCAWQGRGRWPAGRAPAMEGGRPCPSGQRVMARLRMGHGHGMLAGWLGARTPLPEIAGVALAGGAPAMHGRWGPSGAPGFLGWLAWPLLQQQAPALSLMQRLALQPCPLSGMHPCIHSCMHSCRRRQRHPLANLCVFGFWRIMVRQATAAQRSLQAHVSLTQQHTRARSPPSLPDMHPDAEARSHPVRHETLALSSVRGPLSSNM